MAFVWADVKINVCFLTRQHVGCRGSVRTHGCVLRARRICVNVCKALKRSGLFPALRITPLISQSGRRSTTSRELQTLWCFDSAVTAAVSTLQKLFFYFFFLFVMTSRHVPTAPSSAAQVTEFCRGERKRGGVGGGGWCVVTEGQSSVSGANAAFRRCRKVLYRKIGRGVDLFNCCWLLMKCIVFLWVEMWI